VADVMTETGQADAKRPRARTRLVQAAGDLFYAEGVRNVPVERILDQAQVTRSTMYRYFTTKEDLVVAYLEEEDARIRGLFADAAAAARTPEDLVQVFVDTITHDICQRGFRGCPFMNAGVEYSDASHPVRRAVQAHRSWFQTELGRVLEAGGHPQAKLAARTLVALRDGSMMGGYLDDRDEVIAALSWAVTVIVGEPTTPAAR
jgi:AcrR family transcriptional regulator